MARRIRPSLGEQLTRRELIRTAGYAGAAGLLVGCLGSIADGASSSIAGQELVYAGYGGPYTDAENKYVNPAFYNKTSCKVTGVQGADPAKLQQMVDNNAVVWDLFPSDPEFRPNITETPNKYWEKIDYTIVNATGIPAEDQFPYGLATDGYSLGIVWRKDKFPTPLTSWADVWDVNKFPGSRCLPRRAADLAEIALMADGVPTRDPNFFPINVDRVVESVKRIKPHVVKYWTGGDQPMQLLLSGEVDVAGVWYSRVFAPVKQGAPVGFTWNQNIFRLGCWSITKGTKHLAAAMQYLAYRATPEAQALICNNTTAVGYTNVKTAGLVTPDHAALLATSPDNWKVTHQTNWQYWYNNETRVDDLLRNLIGV